MIDISEIIKQVEAQIGPFTVKMVSLFKVNLVEAFKEAASGEIKNHYLAVYDDLVAITEGRAGPAIKDKDPTSLKNLRPLFESQISSELKAIRLEGDEIVIELMDRDKIGYGAQTSGEPITVDVLAFYIEGVVGEFAFITPDQYKVRRKGRTFSLGRFGAGFMMSRKSYEAELWKEVTGVSFEAVRHPISGLSPFTGFKLAPQNIDFSKFMQVALSKTLSSLDGKKV